MNRHGPSRARRASARALRLWPMALGTGLDRQHRSAQSFVGVVEPAIRDGDMSGRGRFEVLEEPTGQGANGLLVLRAIREIAMLVRIRFEIEELPRGARRADRGVTVGSAAAAR